MRNKRSILMSMKNRVSKMMGAAATEVAPPENPDRVHNQVPPGPKTAPGHMMAFMAKESSVLKENASLRQENEALKSFEVSIDLIDEVPGRRRVLSPEEYASLLENLRVNVLATPITLRSMGNGRFEAISGHNRLSVFRDLGRLTISAFVRDFDDAQAEAGALYANLLQSSLPDFEKWQGFRRLIAVTGKTQAEVAKDAGIDRTLVTKLFAAFESLPPAVIAKIAQKPSGIGWHFLEEIKGKPQIERAVAALIDEGLSAKDAAKLADEAPVKPTVERPSPVTINRGNKKFAQVASRPGQMVVRFFDQAAQSSLEAEIEALIRAKSKG
jgi:ParB family chromosome partitioning protein